MVRYRRTHRRLGPEPEPVSPWDGLPIDLLRAIGAKHSESVLQATIDELAPVDPKTIEHLAWTDDMRVASDKLWGAVQYILLYPDSATRRRNLRVIASEYHALRSCEP